MRENEELTEPEREWLAAIHPKALRMIEARDARLRAFENDVHFYVGKLDRIDALAAAWSREGEPEGSNADVRMNERECGEALLDILGGYRERVARLRAEGWTLPTKPGQ